MKSIMFFPPGWTPYSPYLALPVLKGSLKSKNIDVDIVDLNVQFFDYILSRDIIEVEYNKCIDILSNLNSKNNQYGKYSKISLLQSTINKIDNAKSIMRSQEFYDQDKRLNAMNIIGNAFHIFNTANEDISVEFNKIRFNFSENSTKEVEKFLNDEIYTPLHEFYNKSINEINKSKKEFVAISITSSDQFICGLLLAKMIKENCFTVKHIVFGGNYITRLANEWDVVHPIFNYIDSIIVYEGENALYELINYIEFGGCISDVTNLVYEKDGMLVKNVNKEVEKKDLVVPDFDGFDLDMYFTPKLILPIYSSRSCYNKCAFCTIPNGTYGVYRKLEIDFVYNMMLELNRKYKTNIFTFVDETFEVKRMEQLAFKISEGNKEFYWYGETRFDPNLNDYMCRILFQGGCRNIQFGLESYNQNILDKMNKKIKLEWIEPNLLSCLSNGIAVHMFFMVGFPTETLDESLNTFEFTDKILYKSFKYYNNPFSSRGFSAFGLNKHSYVWSNPKEFGIELINDEYNDLNLGCDYITTSGLSHEESEKIVKKYSNSIDFDFSILCHENFFSHQSIVMSEEHNFICRVNNISSDKNLKINVWKNIDRINNNKLIKINGDVSIKRLGKDIISYKNDNELCVFVYCDDSNVILKFSHIYYDILRKVQLTGISINELTYNNDPELINIIEKLIYYRMTNITNDEYFDRINLYELAFNDEILSIDCNISKMSYMYNLSNGKAIRVNEFSKKILQIFEHPMNYSTFVKYLKEKCCLSNIDPIVNLIQLALEASVLIVKDGIEI